MFKQLFSTRVGIQTNWGSSSENCCTSQFVYRIYAGGTKRDQTPHRKNVESARC